MNVKGAIEKSNAFKRSLELEEAESISLAFTDIIIYPSPLIEGKFAVVRAYQVKR